jgi:hypothetical protein
MADFFENIAPKVGITADAFKGLSGRDALQLYVSSLEKANLSQQEMTFYMEALASDSTALLPIFSENGKVLGEVAAKARELGLAIDQSLVDGAGKMTRDWNIVREVMGVQLQQALVQLAPAFQEMMGNILPIIESIMLAISGLAEGFANLPESTQGLIGTGIAIFAGLGPVILGIGLAATAVGAFGTALSLLAKHPVVLTIGLIAGGAWLIYKNWDGISSWFAGIWDAIESAASTAWEGIKSTIGAAIDFVSEKWNAFIGLLKEGLKWAQDVGAAIAEAIGLGETFEKQREEQGLVANTPESRAVVESYQPGGSMYGIGTDAADGFVAGFGDGMKSGAGEIEGYLKGVEAQAKDVLEIKSPSRVFRRIGTQVSEGFALGIGDGKPLVDGAITELTESATEKTESAADELRATGKSLFREWVTGAKSAGEALAGLADRLAGMLADSAFDSLFGEGGIGGGLFSGIASLFGFADGGAFNGGRVTAFANGGVVSSPTTFGMANGGMGLMGEAGPEAIMPLTRGPGGRLGVQAHGGGGGMVRIIVEENPMFASRVQAISQDQAVTVVRQYDAEIAPISRARPAREVG